MIELKTLTPDDWLEWRDLRLRALADALHAFSARIEDWQGADDTRWRQRLSLPGSCNIIARCDGIAVGMVSGISTEQTEAKALIALWVAPDARGRGVGDALTTAIAHWATALGARELRLDVAAANTSAIALYARHGFVDVDVSQDAGSRAMVKVLGN